MLTIIGLLVLWACWRTVDVLCPWFHRLGNSAQAIVLVVGIYAAILVGWQILSMATAHPRPVMVQQEDLATAAEVQERIDALRLQVRVQEKLAELRARQVAQDATAPAARPAAQIGSTAP